MGHQRACYGRTKHGHTPKMATNLVSRHVCDANHLPREHPTRIYILLLLMKRLERNRVIFTRKYFFDVSELTGLPLMAYIYAIDLQELEDVVVRRNIAKDSSWVRNRIKAFATACALRFCREFEPRSGIAIRFDPRGYRGSFFLPFFTGPNNTNPVND